MRREKRERLKMAAFAKQQGVRAPAPRRPPQPDMSVPPGIRDEVWRNVRGHLEAITPTLPPHRYFESVDLRDQWMRHMTTAKSSRLLGDPRRYQVLGLRLAGYSRLTIAQGIRDRAAERVPR